MTAAVMNVTGGALAIETYKDMDHGSEIVQAGLGMGVSITSSRQVVLLMF